AFIGDAVEKRGSKTPEKFGTGMIEGVAGPEAANNGATAGAMVPLLSLGIPFSPATAILLGALVVHGLQPVPSHHQRAAVCFWGFRRELVHRHPHFADPDPAAGGRLRDRAAPAAAHP